MNARLLSKSLQFFCAALPERFQWTPHNLVAHPASEVFFQLGYKWASDWIHDATVPIEYDPETARG